MFIDKKTDIMLSEMFDLYTNAFCDALPKKENLSDICFTSNFENKMQKLIKAQKKPYYYLINTVGKRVAIIITAIIIALTSTTVGVKAIRDYAFDLITKTYKKFTQVTVGIEVSDKLKEFVKHAPQYIPEGYELEMETYGDDVSYHIVYINSEKQSISYTQQAVCREGIDVDTEGAEVKTIYINSYEGIICENKGYISLFFANEDYFFTITAKISAEELQKVAESIPINK